MLQRRDWEIPGAEQQPILGTSYEPSGTVRGCAIIAHGFKGYNDFRMIPPLAQALSEAEILAHTFNFSHSGVTRRSETFERPDLFERDTWNKQVADVEAIVKAMVEGRLAGGGLPYLVVGHSRGGVTAILFAGRLALDPHLPLPAGIVAAGSPHQSCSLRAEQKEELRSAGWLESPSSRTGQVLRIGRAWLEEQEADPAGHDVLQNTKNIQCPVLIVHGEEDETVSVESGVTLAAAARNARLVRIPGCNHVFNAPNPPPSEVSGIPQLAQFTREVASFAHAACPTRHGDVAV